METYIDKKDLGVIDGLHLVAYTAQDDTVYDRPIGDYAPDVIKAWRAGDWWYETVTVTASRNGVVVAEHSRDGRESGDIPGIPETVHPLTDQADLAYFIEEVIAKAKAAFRTIFSLAIRWESDKPDETQVTLWPSRQAALDAVRSDFDEELQTAVSHSSSDLYGCDVTTDAGMLEHLYSVGVYVTIDEHDYRR